MLCVRVRVRANPRELPWNVSREPVSHGWHREHCTCVGETHDVDAHMCVQCIVGWTRAMRVRLRLRLIRYFNVYNLWDEHFFACFGNRFPSSVYEHRTGQRWKRPFTCLHRPYLWVRVSVYVHVYLNILHNNRMCATAPWRKCNYLCLPCDRSEFCTSEWNIRPLRHPTTTTTTTTMRCCRRAARHASSTATPRITWTLYFSSNTNRA